MLSQISMADMAVPACLRTRMGASPRCLSTVPRDRALELAAADMAVAETLFARPRPQVSSEAVLFGNGAHATGQTGSVWNQRTTQKPAHTTRIAAAGGGALGPHPARDPV